MTDAGLKKPGPLTKLQSLSLMGTQVTDNGLKDLAHFRDFRVLDLSCTRVTDAGLKELAASSNSECCIWIKPR